MKNFIFLTVLVLSVNTNAQELRSLVTRSTITSVTNLNSYKSNHILQQSIGQSSLTGDFSSGNYLLSQGFVQSSIWGKITQKDFKVDLNAKVYPNPFVDNINIEFLHEMDSDIKIFVFSEKGDLINTHNFKKSNSLSISLSHLPSGKYFLNILSGERQHIARLIKLK